MQNESREIRYGVWLQNGYALSVEQVVAFGVEAEKAGWGGVFVSDEPSNYSDPWTALAAIAAQTERIRLGTWVTPVCNSPVDALHFIGPAWRYLHGAKAFR